MKKISSPKWLFSARLKRQAYNRHSSSLVVKRVKEAVGEIRKAAAKDPLLGAEGAVLFLEKVSPALKQVDSSSGAIGTAVNQAIEELVPIIAAAPADDRLRHRWLERMAAAIDIDMVRLAWSPDPGRSGFFKFTTACLSTLHQAGRFGELLTLLEQAPHKMWFYRKWGVKSLISQGRKAEALRYAEDSSGLNNSPAAITRIWEEIFLSRK